MKITILPLIAVAFLASPLRAEDGGKGGKSIFAVLDTNTDGTLDPTELGMLNPNLHQKLLDIYDANNDGSITTVEFQNGKLEHEQEHVEKKGIAGLDINNDGVIDATELAVLKPELQAKLLAAFDTNMDGVIDANEIAAAQAFDKEELARIDTNHDGVLDDAELNVLDPATKAALLAKFDANQDGVITRDEVKAVYAKDLNRFEHQSQFVLDKFDANDNGKLDPVEQAAVRKAIKEHKARLIAKFDLNKDGKLDATERAGLKAVLEHKKPRKTKL